MASQSFEKVVRYFIGAGIVLTAGCQSMSQVTIRVRPSGDVEVQMVPKENRDVRRSIEATSDTDRPVHSWPILSSGSSTSWREQDAVCPGLSAQVHHR